MAIAHDNSTSASQASGTSLTFSHTVSGSNRILFVSAYGGADGTDITGMTYNGVAMTFIAKAKYAANNSYMHTYYLIAPATGANNVVVSYNINARMGAIASSYTGVKQTGQPDAFNKTEQGNATSITTNVTVVATGCWIYCGNEGSNCMQSTMSPSGNLTTFRTSGIDDAVQVADSNGTVGTGTQAAGFTNSGSTLDGIVAVSFAPDLGISQNLNETVTNTDTLSKSTIRTLLEAVTNTDSLTALKVIARILTETVTNVANVTKSTIRTITEAVTNADTLLKMVTKRLNETVTNTDNLTTFRLKIVLLIESLNVSATIQVFLNGILLSLRYSKRYAENVKTFSVRYADNIKTFIKRYTDNP